MLEPLGNIYTANISTNTVSLMLLTTLTVVVWYGFSKYNFQQIWHGDETFPNTI